MKKGLHASLSLPKELLDLFIDNNEKIEEHMHKYSTNIYYEIYLGEMMGEEFCGIDLEVKGKTYKEVENDYKHIRVFLNEIAKQKTRQVILYKFQEG